MENNDPATTPTTHTPPTRTDRAAAFSGHIRDAIIVGAGQAGLATAYHLQRRGVDCLVLEAADRIGDQWRHRYDSLLLFTANRFNSLPGLRFPGDGWGFPGKDEVAAVLQTYAERYELPVLTGSPVRHVTSSEDGFTIATPTQLYRTRTLIVATGPFGQLPNVPEVAELLAPNILQLHSSQYRRPGQVPEGPVLVVGGGHSGCDIALELAHAGFPTTLAGRDLGQIPIAWDSPLLHVVMRMVMFQHVHLLRRGTRSGRLMRQQILHHHGAPRLRVQARDLDDAGVMRTEARVTGARNGVPELADGTVVPAATVVWATGYRHDYSWLHLPVTDQEGWPREYRGISTEVEGLFFCGLAFQTSLGSMNFFGVGRDADYVARKVAARVRAVRGRVTSA